MKFDQGELQVIQYALEKASFPGSVSESVTSAKRKVKNLIDQFDNEEGDSESGQED